MSYFLRVFCQSSELVPISEITDFIQDGSYFEEQSRFVVCNVKSDAEETHWQSLTIHYETGKRPIVIERNINDELLHQEVKETIEMLKLCEPSRQQSEIIDQLSATKQVIAIEIDFDGLRDAAWEMLDCLEAHLASILSGIIYAPNDGFYDRHVQLIYQLREKQPVS